MTPGRPSSPPAIRRATDEDRPAVVELCRAALGWHSGATDGQLFEWKHSANPFGPSPTWVAVEPDGPGERIIGVRTFLRWHWTTPSGQTLRSVRAVDTATHPESAGRGVFTALTRHALDELADEGTDFVFNTPNDKSRPGYLKMGWRDVGRVPVAVAVRSPRAALRIARARVPADKWSLDTTVGEPAEAALADDAALERLLSALPPPTAMRTARSPGFLRWRYTEGPLEYRALRRGDAVEDGLLIFRLRARGPAVEATVCDVLVPAGDRFGAHVLLRRLVHAARPDYAIRTQHDVLGPGWAVQLPGQGPRLTWRAVCRAEAPTLDHWDLRLGDLELF